MKAFGTLNWCILAVYVLIVLALGLVLSRRVTTAEDFYIGRRTTPWWAIGISVVATYVSALSFLGGPAWSYGSGLGVIAIHLNYPLVIVVVITVFLPFFYNSRVASIYDYVERRFGATSRAVVSALFLWSQALTSAAVLYTTALVVQFITGVDVRWAIVLMSTVALVYTFLGGTVAVIWTDVFQASVLFLGAAVVFGSLVHRLPLPFGTFLHQLGSLGKTHALELSPDPRIEATLWSGAVGMFLYHVTVYGSNQMMVQRTLAARNLGDAKKSYLLMGFAAFFIYFAFFLLGVLFYGYYGGRHFPNGNTIILEFAADQHIPGLMGVICASIVAASMSSLGAALNSLATISTLDFYQKYVNQAGSQEHYLGVSRAFTLVWAMAIIVPAILYSTSNRSILQVLSKVGAYFVGANLTVYGLGFFSRQTTEKGLLIGIVVGFVSVWMVGALTEIAWPWYGLISSGISILIALPASRWLDGPQPHWSPYSIPGQQQLFAQEGQAESESGWYVVPGKVDKVSYLLCAFFIATILFLVLFEWYF